MELLRDRIGDLQRDAQNLPGELAQLHQINNSLVWRLRDAGIEVYPDKLLPKDSPE